MSELEAARLALDCLDLTSLNDGDDDAAIDALCRRAVGSQGKVAAVCVWPRFVAQARAALPRDVAVAAVANFPDGRIAPHGECDPVPLEVDRDHAYLYFLSDFHYDVGVGHVAVRQL